VNGGGEFPYAIQAAAYMAGVETAEILVHLGADVNKYGGKWHSTLQAAASDANLGSPRMARLLLSNGADVNATGGLYGTALQAAYRDGYYNIIWTLYASGASHSITGGKWGTALGSAISGACHTLLQQFVKTHMVDVNQPCGKWGTHLHFVIDQRDCDEEELVKIFLEAGADINAVGGRWSTPLGEAVIAGEGDVVENLLKMGGNRNLVDDRCG